MTAQLDAVVREVAEHVFPLSHIPEAVSAVRRRVRTVLADWNLAPEVAEDALLVISEMITNAVVHALPPAALRLSRIGADGHCALRVEVTDAGPAPTGGLPAGGCDTDEHGRGLGIVSAVSAQCGTQVHAGGVTRWAELIAA